MSAVDMQVVGGDDAARTAASLAELDAAGGDAFGHAIAEPLAEDGDDLVHIRVAPARGSKCQRCWHVAELEGDICARCTGALEVAR